MKYKCLILQIQLNAVLSTYYISILTVPKCKKVSFPRRTTRKQILKKCRQEECMCAGEHANTCL